MYNLVDEVIAEIKRDVHMDNLFALRELLEHLIKIPDCEHKIRSFLSEFPELREEFKDD
jgi:hypothetical protein